MLIALLLISVSFCSLFETESPKLYSGSIKGYHTIQQTSSLISQWSSKNPDLVIPPFQIGRTFQNHPILMFGITKLPMKDPNLLRSYPSILLTSMIHPRQRSSLTTLLATFLEILSLSHQSDKMNYLLDTSVVWFVPYVNLDAARYVEGIWDKEKGFGEKVEFRKNRNGAANAQTKCNRDVDVGVDLNRNFDVDFGSMGVKDMCSEEYPGVGAFSEKETQAIRRIFHEYRITLAIDIHTYGNTWIHPYSHDQSGHLLRQNQTQFNFYKHIKKHFQKQSIVVSDCYSVLGYKADGVYIDWALTQGVLSFAFEVGSNFTEPMKQLKATIDSAMEQMTYMLMRNSYEVECLCVGVRKEGVVEVVVRSNSLVEVRFGVGGMLYWKIKDKVMNQTEVTLGALDTVILGFREGTQKSILQFTIKQPNTTQQIIYTQQIFFPHTLPACRNQNGLSDNLIIGLVISLFFLCLFGCIIFSCVAPQKLQKPKMRYDVVDPQSSQVVI